MLRQLDWECVCYVDCTVIRFVVVVGLFVVENRFAIVVNLSFFLNTASRCLPAG